jgi:hypothetical protein
MATKIPLKRWTRGGAPVWDIAAQRVIIDGGTVQRCLYLPSEGKVIAGGPIACVRDDGTVLWAYKDNWSGVHGSHSAPIPERDDQLIGTLGCIGKISTPLGTVFGMHSNMGRLYLVTTDGLFVAAVFQDSRLGGDAWPATPRAGAPLGGVTMGSEWFGGHLFQAAKSGECYLIAGFTAYNLIKLNGLDSLKAIPGEVLNVTPAALGEAKRLSEQGAAGAAHEKTLTIARAAGRRKPVVGDVRLLISVYKGKPVAVLYRWKVNAGRDPVTFTCPWRSHTVDRVEVIQQAKIAIQRRGGGRAACLPRLCTEGRRTISNRRRCDLLRRQGRQSRSSRVLVEQVHGARRRCAGRDHGDAQPVGDGDGGGVGGCPCAVRSRAALRRDRKDGGCAAH